VVFVQSMGQTFSHAAGSGGGLTDRIDHALAEDERLLPVPGRVGYRIERGLDRGQRRGVEAVAAGREFR
jgi:hypothetical protein